MANAQKKIVSGVVKDVQSDEPIPFASVSLKLGQSGSTTDTAGIFSFTYTFTIPDTLLITSVGYKPVAYVIPQNTDSVFLNIKMEIAPVSKDAVVKVKFNRALWFWNRIMKNKPKHDNSSYQNYYYEVYNKLELDLNNVNKEKLGNNKILKPFNFILNNIDSTEEKPFLPLFLTETISDYYFQRSPKRVKEVIKGSKTNGIQNESVTKMLGGMYQNVNVYHNFIPVFDKQFASPFHDNGDYYYNFKLLDTQYLNNKRLVHLAFRPKRKGENTFEGDCWVVDSTYALQKITLRPSEGANLNFVQKLTLIQEFRLINDSTWFLSKDKFVADISPIGKSRSGFKGRKTSTYRNVLLNADTVVSVLKTNRKAEEVIVLKDAELKVDTFWSQSRHEELSKNEAAIYKMIDTIQSLPQFQKYSNAINFIGTGYKSIGNFNIGPWFNWISGNSWEGTRLRFDVSTNSGFNRKIYLHTYLAYGFGDKKYKGQAEIFYLPKKDPRFYISAGYKNDLDNGQQYYDEISTDNIFALAFRKPNVPVKFQKIEEKKLEIFQETRSGISFLLGITNRQVTPLRNLPAKSYFTGTASHEPLANFETSLRIRYAYLERFLENTFFRTSLGSDFPIIEARYSKGWAGVLKSSYNYNKITGSISDYMNVPPYGNFYYNFFAGRVYGTLPYPLLEIHPGNEIFYYNKYAFNMMNRFEYISDRYAGFNLEHNIGNGLFKFIPLTRKLKFRQFWSAKGVWGDLSKENRSLNFVGDHPFQSLDKKMYMEVGTGVDNILKVIRLDFVWRVLPTPLPKEQLKRFGIFGSFRVQF
ncbi:MAG: carboxypeptidase-like regulatory protein [Segetibacter sp.]|nr:carboxypeptidase-like regulatory protein [Segetibacter sp.]